MVMDGEENRQLPLAQLSLLALGLGVVTGVGAVLFRDLIGLIHNLLFTGQAVVHYDANIFTAAAPWGPLVILVPVLGAVGVTFLVTNFAPEAKGHGVPEVMDAIYYKGGVIRPVVALVKSLASALAIGSGASVGREGPIIQIGSALGSTLGQIIRMPAGQRIALVAAGAGAGIASTFNTPIGGVMFAIELMMPEVSVETFLPVAIATGTATFVGRWFFGDAPAFHVPPLQVMAVDSSTLLVLVLFAVLGRPHRLRGGRFHPRTASGRRYLRSDQVPLSTAHAGHADCWCAHVPPLPHPGSVLRRWRRLRHRSGGAGGTDLDILAAGAARRLQVVGDLASVWGRAHPAASFRRRCSWAPRLAAAFAALLNAAGLPIQLSVPAFAMVGMGAMVGGGTGAVMTAVTMIFEMTLDYSIVMPMIVAVAMSIGARRVLSRETIYTLKLVRRGRAVPKARHVNMFLVRSAREVMDADIQVLPAEASFDEYLRQPEHAGRLRHVVVTDKGHIYGVIRVNTGLRRGLEGAHTGVSLGDVSSRNFTVVREDETAFDVIRRMWRRNAIMAVVVRGHGIPRGSDVAGVITKEHVADSVADSVKAYPQ